MIHIDITQPFFFDDEARMINRKLARNVDFLHLRKPGSTIDECRHLLSAINPRFLNRIVTHDHFELATEFGLHGVHLNGRNPLPPDGWKGSVSCSCHTLEEVAQRKRDYDYVSLSPIFDSISKRGYKAAFTIEQLQAAHGAGIIDSRVMALGGVTPRHIGTVQSLGFGGYMMLGNAWSPPVVLTIAGSDTSAGAGIQQDLKTMTAMGCYGATVITALTSQNTLGVQDVMAVPCRVVQSQMQSVLSDLDVSAIKIGQVPDSDVAHTIVQTLSQYYHEHKVVYPVVYDPVMVSTSGRRLMNADTVDVVTTRLFPLCTLITPNIPEAEHLLGRELLCDTDIVEAGGELVALFGTNFLLKGGHADGDSMTDRLFLIDGTVQEFHSPRIMTTNLHGTGCTLSSAIASCLAQGYRLADAVDSAKRFVTKAIEAGRNLHIGSGNGPLWCVEANK